MSKKHEIKSDVKALSGQILVEDMEVGDKLVNGIIRLDDNGKGNGIRPRWAKVYSIGPDVTDVYVGTYILVQHGQWTRRVDIETETGRKSIQKVKPEEILLVSDDKPDDTKWVYRTVIK